MSQDPDALALASMIADSLRGQPIDVRELPDSAMLLVAAYVAKLDYGGTSAEGFTGVQFMGNPLRVKFRARGPGGRTLPEVPDVRRGRGDIIDIEPGEQQPRIIDSGADRGNV